MASLSMVPDRGACLALLQEQHTPAHIQRHCIAVAEEGLRLGRRLNDAGQALDLALIEAGGLLHDILRLEPDHAAAGAALLLRLGYPRLAEVVAVHMDLHGVLPPAVDEALIVFLADKQVREDYRVTVEQRYGVAIERFPGRRAEIEVGMNRAIAARRMVEAIIGPVD